MTSLRDFLNGFSPNNPAEADNSIPMNEGGFGASREQALDEAEENVGEEIEEAGLEDGYDHFENLAAVVSQVELQKITYFLKEKIKEDSESREDWLNLISKRMQLLNISEPPERGNGPFPGSSNSLSSGVLKAWVNLTTQIKTELLAPDGPCKIKIAGPANDELERISNRKKDFINYLLTRDSSFYSEKEKNIDWAVLMGSSFSKISYNHVKETPESTFIKPQNVIVNGNVTSLDTAERITLLSKMNDFQLSQRVASGLFLADILMPGDDDNELDDNARKNFTTTINKILGIQETSTPKNDDEKYYYVAETQFYADIETVREKDARGKIIKKKLPYLIYFDYENGKVAGLYRNWDREDKNFKRLTHITHWKAFNGLGFYGLGLLQLVGNLAEKSGKILRMYENSGYLSNTSGYIAVKGLKAPDSAPAFDPTAINFVELGGVENIQQALMPIEYKEPSPALKLIYDEAERDITEISGAAVMPFSEMSQNQPAATTFAALEQTNRVQNGVVKKFYQSLKDELGIIDRAIINHMADMNYPFFVIHDETGELSNDIKIGHDFNHKHLGVVPVADPNVTSSIQRLIRSEAIFSFLQNLNQSGVKVDLREGALNLFNELKVGNINKIMPDPNSDKPKPLDPVSENVNMMQGLGAEAAAWQDHQAHIQLHQAAMAGLDPQSPNIGIFQAHIAQHQAFLYRAQIEEMLGEPLPENLNELPPDVQNQIAQAIAQQQAQQQQQQQEQGGGPVDPNAALMVQAQAEQLTAETKARELDMKYQVEFEKLQAAKEKAAQDYEIQYKKLELELKKHEESLNLQDQVAALKAEIELIKANKEHKLPRAENESLLHGIENLMGEGETESEEANQIPDNPYPQADEIETSPEEEYEQV